MIKFEKISEYENVEDFKMPIRATASSAGYDIFNNTGNEIMIKPHEAVTIPTGLKTKMPIDMVLKIYPRSGHGFKYGIRLQNTVGIIDADYYNNEKNEGHIFVKLHNSYYDKVVIQPGEAFAQGIFEKYYLVEGDSYGQGNLRAGGIGSTT